MEYNRNLRADLAGTASDTWYQLSAAQRGFWFLYRLQPETQGVQNLSFSVRILGELDTTHLSTALNVLAERHPILRARFRETGGEPEQCIDACASVRVEVFEAGELDEAALGQRLAEEFREAI